MPNRLKGFIYCILRDGKYYAFYTHNPGGKGTKSGFSSKYCTPYMTPVVCNPSWTKEFSKKDYTKSAYHPNSSSLGAIAKSIYRQVKQPGDRFVIHRMNSKKCPFNVHFLPTVLVNKQSKLFSITPKV